EALDVTAAARGTAARHRLRAAAVVTLQSVEAGVIHESDAAMGTLAHLAAIPAEHEGGQAAPVQEQNRLLAPLERTGDGGLQVATQRAEVLRRDLLSHVDDRHRRQG